MALRAASLAVAFGSIHGVLLQRQSLQHVDPLARCVDGSPAIYYWKPSSSSNSSTWIVDLEGGGWCDSKEDCFWHCLGTPHLCSSKLMPETIEKQGLLDDLLDPVLKDANPGGTRCGICWSWAVNPLGRVNLDYMPDILGPAAANVKVIGFLDSPFWLDMPPYAGSSFIGFNNSCKQVYDMANVTRLGPGCAAHYPAEPWKCIMGQQPGS
eukprot:s1919_g3.t1